MMTYHSKKFDFKVFKSNISNEMECAFELDLSNYIDYYTYHDAPSSIWVEMTIHDLIAIRNKLNTAIEMIEKE